MARRSRTSDLKFPKKRKGKKAKLTAAKVQPYFNAAIRRRDNRCVMEHTDHAGNLEASHFFPVKSNGSLRFYPPNAHCQCSKHHKFEYHEDSPIPYTDWMRANVPELDWMESVRKRQVRYTQEALSTIRDLCLRDALDELQVYIETLLGGKE